MLVWVTRDLLDTSLCCGIFESRWKPELNRNKCYPVSDADMTVRKFAKRYGFTPLKGSCKQMNLELTEIKT